MAGDRMRELLDLAAVNSYYLSVLEKLLGHAVPIAREVKRASGDAAERSVITLKHWLALLDLAITPMMVRDHLGPATPREQVEALLRYCVQKASATDADRDKADFVAAWLFRNPHEGKAWGVAGAPLADVAFRFEAEIRRTIGDLALPALPEEHRQLAREFDFLQDEAGEFRHFDELVDSEILVRVRELKHSFRTSFYHPYVLSRAAAFNSRFGERFDVLFTAAAREIREYAERIQKEGASIMSRVDGDVLVKQLAEVKRDEIMQEDYTRSKDDLRKVSRYRKAVQNRRVGRSVGTQAAAAAPAAVREVAAPAELQRQQQQQMPVMTRAEAAASAEETRAYAVIESIRNFLRAAGPKTSGIVPLRTGNITLTPNEIDAFRTEFGNEKSFRADYANALMHMVATQARMSAELQEFTGKQASEYLWKPHADSLTGLLSISQRLERESEQLRGIAQQRGLVEKAKGLDVSLERLRCQAELVVRALRALKAS